VGVHDRGEEDGQLWISMDFVDGLDAARLLADRYPAGMPVEDVARIVTAVASALDYAHKQGLLHRDVKPANIMLTHLDDDGEQRILLTDFGIARDVNEISGLTATNMTVGTVAYSAPEQLLGEDIDGRTDQYALAATAYHLLTGSHLFPHSNPIVVSNRHINNPPPALSKTRPELAQLDPILAIALAKDADDRFQRCSDFARALSDESSEEGVASANATTQAVRQSRSSTSTMAAGQPKRPAARSRLVRVVLGGFAATVLLIGVIGVVLWRPWQHSPSSNAVISSSTAPTTLTTTATAAGPAPVPTRAAPEPPLPTSTVATPSATVSAPSSNPNGPGCSQQRRDKCGQWTPEEAAFACRAIASGADYTAGLKYLLMNRYGLDENSAFFLGKEAWYSVSSGGYINTGGNADGPHPLCNDIIH
jgi:serine/threonine-protein kinase